jgi:hypothetical protein
MLVFLPLIGELKNEAMRKREFFKYNCGRIDALSKLEGVFDELKEYEDQIVDLGTNATKFGNPESIEQPTK